MSNYEPPAPPPPPGGYGAPPPPPGGYGGPPGDGYGGPPPGGYGAPKPSGWDLGTAVKYGWEKFQANAGPIIGAIVVMFVAVGVLGGIGALIQSLVISPASCEFDGNGNFNCTNGSGFVVRMILSALISALVVIGYQIIGAGIIRASLKVTEGAKFEFGEILKFENVGNVVVTSLLIGAGTFVGTILCYLPGIVFAFVSSYAMYFVVDKNAKPFEAITASLDLVKNNLGNAIVWYIVGGLIAAVGICACGVGLLVTVPITMLGTAYSYKIFSGQTVVA